MQRADSGLWRLDTKQAHAGSRYFVMVDNGEPRPDPVSRLLPDGVHGPTEIVDPRAFSWTDEHWRGLPLRDYLIYELHVGTFTPEGTFDGVISKLDYLKNTLGVTAIELMPVAAFPGKHNWGYDGVSMYAVQASYGGPDGLKRLVNAAHEIGLAVMLDAVYNHLGNEGNYLRSFGPYFTPRHKTPWGDAINYDQPGSDAVREYVIQNALYWIREYHFDGLRLDAVQTIADDSPKHIIQEVGERVHELGREGATSEAPGRDAVVIAETDENDVKTITPASQNGQGGWGMDAVWSDDFHHSLHAFYTGENRGYYQDFGKPEQIVRALNDGFVFQGERFNFWGKARGTNPKSVWLPAHVVCIQNHDQVGNRALGDRLTGLVSRGIRKQAAALLLLAPHTPLLWMGQEWDESNPFQFFVDYGDPTLTETTKQGRMEEFAAFGWTGVADPTDPATFERSRLNWNWSPAQREMLDWYRRLIELRKRLVSTGERTCTAEIREGNLVMKTPSDKPLVMLVAALSSDAAKLEAEDKWRLMLATDEDGRSTQVYEWDLLW